MNMGGTAKVQIIANSSRGNDKLPRDFLLQEATKNKEENMAELSELSAKLLQIKSQIESDLTGLTSSKAVFEYRKSVMDSKEGTIGSLMKEMGKIPKEQKA